MALAAMRVQILLFRATALSLPLARSLHLAVAVVAERSAVQAPLQALGRLGRTVAEPEVTRYTRALLPQFLG